MGASTLTYAIWMLLRPVLLLTTATEIERQQAQSVVEQHGRSSLARFCLLPDKSYYFSPTGKTAIAYVAKGKSEIALGDPIGVTEDIKDALIGYREFCANNDWYPAFYQTLPDNLDVYRALGWRTLKIGEEAIIDLKITHCDRHHSSESKNLYLQIRLATQMVAIQIVHNSHSKMFRFSSLKLKQHNYEC